MKKILCPTNFSVTAYNSISYASKLAQHTGSELTLFHAHSLTDFAPADLPLNQSKSFKTLTERLKMESDNISRLFHIACHAELKSSSERISHIIREKGEDYDLIIMGSGGPDDLYHLITGTNTYNTILQATTPILLVPDGFLYSPIQHVVYAFDYLRESKLPLLGMLSFLKAIKAELTVLQILGESEERERESHISELQSVISKFYSGNIPLQFETIRSDDIPGAIHDYTAEKKTELLALCSVHRNMIQRLFHKSIIREICTLCKFPVLIFHE